MVLLRDDAWLSLTPEPERLLPEARAILRTGLAPPPAAALACVRARGGLAARGGRAAADVAGVARRERGAGGDDAAALVRDVTGASIGGVPPFGHPAPVETVIDEDLLAYDEVWAAAGTPTHVFPIAPAALVERTAGRVARVAG